RYFDDMVPPNSTQHNAPYTTWSGPKRRQTVRCEGYKEKILNEFFGDMPLVDIKKETISEFRRFLASRIGTYSRNRYITFLAYLMNQAVEMGVLESAPKIKKESERGLARGATVTEEQYRALLANMGRAPQRVLIAWWEASLRHKEVFNLRWDMIDLKANLIRMPSSICKEKAERRVVITWALRQVLLELKEEALRTGARHGYVFTRKGA